MPWNPDLLSPGAAFDSALTTLVGHRQAIDADAFDQSAWEGITEQAAEVQKLQQEGEARSAAFPPLLADLFYSLYKMQPELRPAEELEAETRPNRSHLERFMATPEYEQLRTVTTMDDYAAAIASLQAGREMLQFFAEQPDVQQAMQQLQQAADQARQNPDDPAAQAAADAAAQQVQQTLDANAPAHRAAMKRAAQSAQKEAGEAMAVASTWGIEPGQLRRLPFDKKKELLDRLRQAPELRRMSALVGRLRNLAAASQRTKLNHQRDELVGVTVGDDLPRALPAELAGLRHPLRRLDTMRRWQEDQLLQFQLRGREKAGRGPLVVLCDSSGSTHGEVADWIRAVALALMEVAWRQRRAYACVFFSSASTEMPTVVCKPRERDPEKVIQVATTWLGGGTDYAAPMARALELLEDSTFDKGDIVMLTDGECELPTESMQRLQEAQSRKGFRIWTVLIGGSSNGEREVARWSTRVWRAQPGDDLASQIFTEV